MSELQQLSGNQETGLSYIVLRTALDQFQKTPADLKPHELESVKKQAAAQFKIQSCVLSTDEARDTAVPSSVVEQSIQQIKKRYASDDEFHQSLTNNGLTEQSLHDSLYRELHVDAVMDKIATQSATISELDATIYYHLHPEKFTSPEKRRLRQILITINDEYEENKRDNAYSRAQEILAKLKQKPKKFQQLALKHSECPTAMHGGLLGEISPGVLFPELDIVAFKLRNGEVSGILETEIGFHILYCESIQPKQTVSLKKALPKILEHLQDKRRRICQKTWLSKQLKNFSG